jgi:hypothetical protein
MEELKKFFQKVFKNREEQLLKSESPQDLIFYVWFDWQSARLHFSLISDFNNLLPFECEIQIVDEIEIILEELLNFPYQNGFSIIAESNEEQEVEKQEKQSKEILKVFVKKIMRAKVSTSYILN